jgi:hypothetical protein
MEFQTGKIRWGWNAGRCERDTFNGVYNFLVLASRENMRSKSASLPE